MPLLDWQIPLRDRLLGMPAKQARLVTLSTGSGKTYIATDYCKVRNEPQLVICQKAVITSWKRVARDMEAADPTFVLNWEQLKTGKYPWWNPTTMRWNLPEGANIIVDEVHRGASGPDSQITKMLALLKGYPVTVTMMSATPASSPLQMRAIGYLMDEHKFTTSSFYDWCRTHGCWYDRYLLRWRAPTGAQAQRYMKAINDRLRDRMLHLKLEDIPGFPECQTEAKLFDLDAKYAKQVTAIYDEMAQEIKEEGHTNPMVAALRARQRAELVKIPLLADLAQEALEEGKSVVLFVSFRETVGALTNELKARDIASVTVMGGQNDNERQANIDMFQANLVHVMVATAGAGGVGISLHDVRHERPRVSFITPNFSASEMKQCLGRIHRAGGTKAVQTFVLIANTIEEDVYRAIRSKFNNIESLVDSDFGAI